MNGLDIISFALTYQIEKSGNCPYITQNFKQRAIKTCMLKLTFYVKKIYVS
ncbi:hypothetical protein MACH09_36730 [Vibrio sp. MACH09]|nr:hypothetical protein MACH09_36730 [Vibrio sp. MACH09]